MGLSRTFVGFSSTDMHYYRLMCAWKNNHNIDFNFTDCQLNRALNSEDEKYIKRICRERINMAGTFISLIGQDTKFKHKYVRWELEVALEKGCRIIGANLNGSRQMNPDTCPKIIRDVGAIFVSFSPMIIAYALQNYKMETYGNWYYNDSVYQQLGL
ncbi:TPA: TIR domain-containing protein [Pasteurella multocida]|uniref:TIR domain-containing protein n=1 Tax=Pasteurella multocida TaxID=747 RepID=UPI0028E096D3|nr:TIR domain-containing protein [Pasteurella multocida]MEB3484554.1 TIR domain-containing protein [Pasteurella multocida]MEB3495010.1 TIR domain-containing protein [Pasteurella multocida]HDR0967239.1 TIR domain-containing protein [Pasteurella multocida]HDR0970146.1 TIR domain-containing protein [Pasteurella multocida]HDR0994490.1 TIR domain-containing protein [Pasteurella multocida]